MEQKTAERNITDAAVDLAHFEEEETRLIHTLQKAEGHTPCFGRSGRQCAQTQCRFMRACIAQSPDDVRADDLILPTLDLEQYEPTIRQDAGMENKNKGSRRYAWIGVGSCGGRILNSFYKLGYRKMIVLNTSRQDLDQLDIDPAQKFLLNIGSGLTGRNVKIAAHAVQEQRQDILHLVRKIFGSTLDHIMICFGAGGGTGTGAVLELIEIAKVYARYVGLKDPDKKVGVMMTLPAAQKIGCPQVALNAHNIAEQLTKMACDRHISPLIIIDNHKINKMFPNLAADSFFPSINNTVANIFSTSWV